jgi:hypothetical protein
MISRISLFAVLSECERVQGRIVEVAVSLYVKFVVMLLAQVPNRTSLTYL